MGVTDAELLYNPTFRYEQVTYEESDPESKDAPENKDNVGELSDNPEFLDEQVTDDKYEESEPKNKAAPESKNAKLFSEWWWKLSADSSVVEIQTDPAPGSAFEDGHTIKNRLSTGNIFGVAHELGLKPGGGGGHVNVDFRKGFVKGKHNLIVHVIAQTEKLVEELKPLYQGQVTGNLDPGKRGEKWDRNSEGIQQDDTKLKLTKLIDWKNEGNDPFVHSIRLAPKLEGHQYDMGQLTNEKANSTVRLEEKNLIKDWQEKVFNVYSAMQNSDKSFR